MKDVPGSSKFFSLQRKFQNFSYIKRCLIQRIVAGLQVVSAILMRARSFLGFLARFSF